MKDAHGYHYSVLYSHESIHQWIIKNLKIVNLALKEFIIEG